MFHRSRQRCMAFLVFCMLCICYVLAIICLQKYQGAELYSNMMEVEEQCQNVTTQEREVSDVTLQEEEINIPMVQGWGEHISRDVRLYIRPEEHTTIISASEICQTTAQSPPLLLLVIIISAIPHQQLRNAIRETWASNLTPDVKVVFFFGKTNNPTLQAKLEEESAQRKDVVQESFIDSYNNLTVKSVMTLKWVQSYCSSVRFVMKADDDLFVNLPSLVTILKYHDNPTNLLIGYLFSHARPILDPEDKWYVPYYMYHGEIYPDYLSGCGYLMSYDVVSKLYQTALDTPLLYLEDIFLTGICAERAGISPRHHYGFTYKRRNVTECWSPQTLTVHRLASEELQSAWSFLMNCSKSVNQN